MTKKRFWMRHAIGAFVVLAGLTIVVRRGAANAPPGRYTVMNGGMPTGTVLDTKTGLTWQQAVPPSTYTWANAGMYCTSNGGALPGTGWRLPSMQELQTIVDDSQKSPPTIDPTAFPGTPDTSGYWTSTPYALSASQAWSVGFTTGISYLSGVSNPGRVRCVR